MKKSIWITGASSGIGEALAKEYDNQEHVLFLSGRNIPELERVKSEIKYAQVHIIPFDISNEAASLDAVQAVKDLSSGQLNLLINNAGISQRSLALDTILEVDKKLIDVNYISQVRLTKAAMPMLLASGNAQIVVITSVMGKIGTPYRSAYAGSKHALHGFFNSLRAELHDKNVSVTIISPGFVQTAISINALTGDGTAQNSMDAGNANGLTPAQFAKKARKAIERKKKEVIISKFKEKFGVFMYKFFPDIFAILIRKMSVR